MRIVSVDSWRWMAVKSAPRAGFSSLLSGRMSYHKCVQVRDSTVVAGAGEAKRVIRDERYIGNRSLIVGVRDAGGEIGGELSCAGGFAGGGEACDSDERHEEKFCDCVTVAFNLPSSSSSPVANLWLAQSSSNAGRRPPRRTPPRALTHRPPQRCSRLRPSRRQTLSRL